MTLGLSEHFGARLTIYRVYGEKLVFELGGEYGEMMSVAWGRQMSKTAKGQGGHLVAILPGRVGGAVGESWSELISKRDYVELELYAHRSKANDPLGWGSTGGYVGVFSGFVSSVSMPTLTATGEQLTTLSCTDQMGLLGTQHFSYWRNVGKVMQGGNENDVSMTDIITRLQAKGWDQSELSANAIAIAAKMIFEGILYNRLGFERSVEGQTYKWDNLHSYSFQSDDFGVLIDLNTLAPEGNTWADAVSWAIDAPFFYEFFLDNVPLSEAGRTLANGGVRDVGRVSQVQRKLAGRALAGQRTEMFVIRPSPFPTYDPSRGGYNGAAWNSLPVIESLPWGNMDHELMTSDQDMYSVFSVDLVNSAQTQADSSTNANAAAQVVGDAEAYRRRIGYNPLDVATKRFETLYTRDKEGQTQMESIAKEELSRRLAWQVFSWNHFNDRFYSGRISGSLDPRARLGVRYLDEGMLYYVEGYQHSLNADNTATTEWTVSRGLSAAAYGLTKSAYPHNLSGRTGETPRIKHEQDLYANYLGRQRPGEQFAPVFGDATQTEFEAEMGL